MAIFQVIDEQIVIVRGEAPCRSNAMGQLVPECVAKGSHFTFVGLGPSGG